MNNIQNITSSLIKMIMTKNDCQKANEMIEDYRKGLIDKEIMVKNVLFYFELIKNRLKEW